MGSRPYEQRDFTVGNVVGSALELNRRFFVHFTTIALAVFLVTNLLAALATVPSGVTTAGLLAIAAAIAGIVGFFSVQGALTVAVDDVRDGSVDTGWRQLTERTRERLPHLVGVAFLVGLTVAGGGGLVVLAAYAGGVTWLGAIVAVVGALFLFTRWSLVTPIVVLEQAGPVTAMRRSWSLVRGHGGRVFLIILVTGLMAGVATAILRAILDSALSGFVAVWLSSTVANVLTTPFVALSWTLMYYHLRRPGPDRVPAPALPAGAAYTE